MGQKRGSKGKKRTREERTWIDEEMENNWRGTQRDEKEERDKVG